MLNFHLKVQIFPLQAKLLLTEALKVTVVSFVRLFGAANISLFKEIILK